MAMSMLRMMTWTISIKMRYMKKSIAERPWRRAVES